MKQREGNRGEKGNGREKLNSMKCAGKNIKLHGWYTRSQVSSGRKRNKGRKRKEGNNIERRKQ